YLSEHARRTAPLIVSTWSAEPCLKYPNSSQICRTLRMNDRQDCVVMLPSPPRCALGSSHTLIPLDRSRAACRTARVVFPFARSTRSVPPQHLHCSITAPTQRGRPQR